MRFVLLLALCLRLTAGVAQTAAPYGVHLTGQALTSLGGTGTRAAVLFFVATDCPISDRSFPEMQRLRREFAPRGVRFWFVYPNATESPAPVRKHQRAFDPDSDSEALLDPADALVRLAGAIVTPEAAVLVPARSGEWKLVYRGRIDDRFVRLGLERPAPTQMLVEQALKAVLAGQPTPRDNASPVGCAIVMRRKPRQ